MSEIEIFNFNGTSVRTVMIGGDPWWVAKDVCDVLEIGNPSDAVKRLDPTDSTLDTIEGSHRLTNLINESGLYDLILDSRKPQAKAFRKWITSEVIPSIRKTGSYGAQAELPQSYSEALRALADRAEALEAANQKIELDAPKVEGYEDLMDSDGFFTMEATAKSLCSVTGGLGRTRLFKELRSMGIVMKDSTLPYQHYIDSGYFIIRLEVNERGAYPYAVTTMKGLEWLRKKFRDAA